MRFQVFLSFCFLLAQSVRCDEEYDPVLSYLNVHPDTVERHDLARIFLGPQDESPRVQFRIFGYDNNIWLHPVDSLLFMEKTPVFKGYTKNNGEIHYRPIPKAMENVGKAFENRDHLASLVIGADVDGSTVNGHIFLRGDNLMIRSVPKHVAKQFLRKRRSTDTPVEPHPNMAYHVAIKLKEPSLESNYTSKASHSISKRWQPPNLVEIDPAPVYPDRTYNTLYPEILVVVDSTYANDWAGGKLIPFLEYLMAFWNGVDLIFRNLEVPRIRLNIAAIVLNSDSESTPYFHNYTEHGVIDPELALEAAAIYFYKYPKFYNVTWDIAVSLTKSPLGNWKHNIHTIGISYKGACSRISVRLNSGLVVNMARAQSLVHDNGAFYGIPVAAHEIAHVMYVEHDNNSYPQCRHAKGFLMAPKITAAGNSHSLSICSLEDIGRAQIYEQLWCLTNKPFNEGRKLPSLMPGKMISLDEQCRALDVDQVHYTSACYPRYQDINICAQTWCKTSDGDCIPTKFAAADGTPCPDPAGSTEGFCLQNTCTTI